MKSTSGDYKIRSFVRREGRITRSQLWALDNLLDVYGLPADRVLDFPRIFSNNNKQVVLEIGFGNGEAMLDNAIQNPGINYVGIEVHRPGVGHLLNKIKQNALTNIRVCNQDAVEVIDRQIPDASLSKILVFFPDPWHKKRHHKRRLLNVSFFNKAERILKPGGILHIATDWEDYAMNIVELGNNQSQLNNLSVNGSFVQRPAERIETKFEKRGLNLGHRVYDIMYKRV